MKPNKEQILASIANMTSICPKGKKEVTALVESIIGEELISAPIFKIGGIYTSAEYGSIPYILARVDSSSYALINLSGGGNRLSDACSEEEFFKTSNPYCDNYKFQLVADNLKDYIHRGGKL